MPKPAIDFKQVSYKYPGVDEWTLKDVNLKIPRNSFYIIAGPVGSGKTTLLMLARGFHKEYGGKFYGDIHVLGKNIRDLDIHHLGSKVGIIFQNPALQLHQLRVIDEVMSAPMYQNLPYERCKRRAQRLIKQILGKEFYNRSPNELSSGEQQKVAIASCLAMKCKILLLDEPFSFMDVKSMQETLKILEQLKKKRMTIVIATHGLERVSRYADRIAVLDNKTVYLEGKTKEILYDERLEQILTAPLSIKTAKELIRNQKLKQRVVDWEELTKKIKLKKVGRVEKKHKKKKPYLELENVSYTYPDGNVGVRDISLEIYKKEIFGIVGHNGSGKTTLAKLILGLLKPNKGKVILAGNNITRMKIHEKAKKIGYVTQDPIDMLFETSVLQECAYGPKCLGYKYPERRARMTLKKLGILDQEKKHPDSLSGGQKRLLSIADILVNDPEVLILDEPEFGLDPKNWRSIVRIVKKLKKQGKTIIVITQDLEVTLFLCDRIAVMNDGMISRIGKPAEIFSDAKFLEKNGLSSLPVFGILDKINPGSLSSEDDFIKAVSEKIL